MNATIRSLEGINFVITGTIPGYRVRDDFGRELTQHGAHQQKAVTNATDVLILGENVGRKKIDDAHAKGVQTISWHDALDLMNGSGGTPAVEPSPPPPPEALPPKRNAPAKAAVQISPMLCKKIEELPSSGDWLYEMKWDGYRGIAHVERDGVVLASRQGKDLGRYAHIAEELALLTGAPCILDGEIVALDEHGHSEFQRLHQGAIADASYVVYDVLELLGENQRLRPLRERRLILGEILQQLRELGGGRYVTESPLFTEDLREQLLAHARKHELEGIVCKKASSRYQEGARNSSWLKLKLRLEQEFVVIGFKPGEGARAGVPGSALLAVNSGSKAKPKWTYCGSVGSGGTYDDWGALERAALEAKGDEIFDGNGGPLGGPYVENEKRLYADFTGDERRSITWVAPTLVVQVKFQRWTDDGVLWHPSMQGQRDDKDPREVKRET